MEGEDLAITVLTCEGDIEDPTFPFKLQRLVAKLQNLISDEENPIKVTKVEPWNSVRVTFNIPLEAAQRLRQLAERGDRVLRELGILSVQIEGDQVITLTLASQYSEPQEIVLRKTSDEQGDVASVSFNIPESVPGPSSSEPAHKNISHFLGNIIGGASSSATNAGPSTRLEKTVSPKPETSLGFRSPNVIAPSSTEPIPFPPSTVITTTAALPSSSHVSPNISIKSPSGFGPFPFASMTHAMNTKNSSSPQYQPILHVQGGSPRLSLSSAAQLTNAILSSSNSSSTSPKVSNSSIQKISRTIANSAFNNVVSRAVPPNAIASTSRANVALSSPLLVNLLQSETTNLQQNNKLMPPPSQASNQGTKKKRKPRKTKDKLLEDGNASSPNFSASPSPPSYQSHIGAKSPGGFDHLSVLGPTLNVPIGNINIASSNSQIANIHPMAQGQPPVSNIKPQTSSIHSSAQGLPSVSLQSQVQGQPMVSTTRPLGHQTLSAFRQTQGHRPVPNIHPQAQGQPQVHTGNLPLHTHIPVGALQVARPSTGNLQSYSMSAPRTTIPINTARSLYVTRDTPLLKSAEKVKDTSLKSDRTSASSTPSTSTPDSNPFPSPPSSTDGKTKHLVNPFTGQLEPMPSDDEEEEESIGSLPPFPDFEIDVSEKSQSERSLSDGGKDNNLSSDTDSGISKSITDVSQSSTDGLTVESGKDSKKSESINKTDSVPSASVTSSIPGEKIKLRLKLDSKSIRESKEGEMKEKRAKDCNPTLNQKIDVALVSIPGIKKSTVSSTSVPEPRVPPLHISLRGPNAAVVVSPRKDDSKSRYSSSKEDHPVGDVPSRVVPKKVRSPRAPRTGDVSTLALSLTGRTLDSADKKSKGSNPKDLKKVKDDFWNQNVKMSMSGGGIVEVSDKLSTSHVSSFDSFISSTSIGSSVVPRKSSSIFSLASRDSCKSEVMTLTSCSTGESVTLHSFVESKSPLPLQVTAVSEAEIACAPQTVKNEVSSNLASVALPIKRTDSEDTSITENEKSPNIPEKDYSHSSAKNSPLMQNNNLPHSPSAPLDSKNDIQKSNCTSDQNLLQSASSLNVVSTVPLSSHSASSPTCNTIEAASDSNVQMQVSESTDAKRLDVPCRVMAKSVDDVTSTTDSQKLQNYHQCNTHSLDKQSTENVDDIVNVDKNVQSELNTTLESENMKKDENFVVNEVQNVIDVNKNNTANKENCEILSGDISSNETSHLVTPKPPSTVDDDKLKTFTNPSDTSNLSVSCLTTVSNTEINNEAESDKGTCLVDIKNPSIAKIITVDNLPIQSHVIEVPSMQNSSAIGKSAEVSSLSTLVSSCGNEYLPSKNLLVVQDANDTSVCAGRVSPLNISLLTMPCNSDKKVKLVNHVNKIVQEAPSVVNESPIMYSPKEEIKLDPVEEERKRCMLLSEVPTSTPGPPPSDIPSTNLNSSKSDKLCSELNSGSSAELIETKNSEDAVLQKSVTNVQSSNSLSVDEKLVSTSTSYKNNTSMPDSTVTSDTLIQPPTSNIISPSKNSNEVEKAVFSTPAIPVTSMQNPPVKPSQAETISTSVLLSNLTSSSITNLVDAGPSLENKFVTKTEIKKETTCAEPVHMASTTANSIVTSLLSPVKYLHNEVSSQKFKLIFKNSGQRSALPGGSSPTGLVVPLNSSKVPIKFVALPGGASALSVRSTSNPNIVEIIGPKTAQNSPSNNPHISSPVRLVVSKMSPTLACANPGNPPSIRNRVLVKSVVVTNTSPSIKLLSANNLYTTTSLSLNTGATSTSTVVQSISSAVVSNSATSINIKLPSDDSKPVTTVENSVQVTSLVSSLEKVTNGNNLPSNSDSSVGLIKNNTVTNASCSLTADSTTKDSCTESFSKNSPLNPVISNSSAKPTVSPDTTSPTSVESTTESITSSNDDLKKEDFPKPVPQCISSELSNKLSENESESVSEKSAADTTTEQMLDEVSSVTCDSEKTIANDKIDLLSDTVETHTETIKENDKCYIKPTNNSDISEKNTSAHSDGSEAVKQTADSAITNSFKYISNDSESSDVADSSIVTQPLCSDNAATDSKLKPDSLTANSDTSLDNCVGIGLEDPCVVENEVIIASNIEVEVSSEIDETTHAEVTENSNALSEHSVTVDSVKCKDEVIDAGDTDSLDSKLDVSMPKFRPLGEDSVGIVDSTETEEDKVVVEDSQLEISLVYSKPVKRKCSENAAELIKACMGVEDGPKRGVLVKNKTSEDITEKSENEKIEENVRMSLRIRREEPLLKKAKGTTVNSDCSTDEELSLSELVSKSRTRDKPTRGRLSNRDSPVEPNHCRSNQRRSGSNESPQSEEMKTRTPRENKREANKKDDIAKKLPERTKRGTFKAQDQVVMSKVGLQRSGRIRDQEVKSNALLNNKEETNSLGAKRKTRNTSESQEMLVHLKRRRYSKDGHR